MAAAMSDATAALLLELLFLAGLLWALKHGPSHARTALAGEKQGGRFPADKPHHHRPPLAPVAAQEQEDTEGGMTWGEFKAAVEAKGVKDGDDIRFIDFDWGDAQDLVVERDASDDGSASLTITLPY